jgi:citrate lyase subunit beta/citryl-CoA lyase
MIKKAAAGDADLVFLDLEDSVAPAEKVAARQNIITGLSTLDWGRKTRAMRINGVHTQWCHDDVIDVVTAVGSQLDVIIIPKVKSPADVAFVDTLLTQLELKLGLPKGEVGIEVLIEEAEALACVEDIARSSLRLEALILGVGDLAASQGVRAAHIGLSGGGGPTQIYPGDMWHYAYSRMIVAARAAGIDAIGGPNGDFRNPEVYSQDATQAAVLGAVGKWCIHPSQISIANEVFAPSAEEIEYARRMVTAVAEAEARGEGAASEDGMLIDAATSRIFQNVLDRASVCGVL